MTPRELHARLEALFGPVATTAKAAAALCVSDRAVQRWCAGDRAIPAWVPNKLTLIEALQQIANGEGVYGFQAYEYKTIARHALSI